MNAPLRGEIWIVKLDPTMDSEIKKTRPALIISNNINNQHMKTITLLPITDKGEDVLPFEVNLPSKKSGLTKESKIKCQQIRTVDKARLTKLIGEIDSVKIKEVEQALLIHLGVE